MNKLRHVGIVTNDIDCSISFYGKLGFFVQNDILELGDYIDNFSALNNVCVRTVKMMSLNGDMIELLCWKSHPENSESRRITQIGCSHIALTVSNLDKMYNKLLESGVMFNSPPQTSPDCQVKVAFCKDPNDVFIELVEEL